jgi:solute carrier family 35 protein F1/2
MLADPKRLAIIVGAGQFIAFLLACTGYISGSLVEKGFSFPVFQLTFTYLLLTVLFLPFSFPLRTPIYLYIVLALLDVEGNYLAVMAYQYTDVTSVLLLNSLTIPWVVILSFFILKRQYCWRQIIGVVLCIGGLGLVVLSDSLRGRWNDNKSRPYAWLGDVICVGSSICYALQNVLQDYLLKRLQITVGGSKREYLGLLGVCGFSISLVQWLILELGDLKSFSGWDSSTVYWLLAGFSGVMLILYVILSWFIERFDAPLFNISSLTSGIYGLLLQFALAKENRISTDWIYIVAYILVVIGVVLYSLNSRRVTKEELKETLPGVDVL